MEQEQKESFLSMILKIAKITNVCCIIFMEGFFGFYEEDRFEDRIHEIENSDTWFFNDDPKRDTGWEFAIDEIWLREDTKLLLKSQRELFLVKNLSNEFNSYSVVSWSDRPQLF
jgi:hypothetical protein